VRRKINSRGLLSNLILANISCKTIRVTTYVLLLPCPSKIYLKDYIFKNAGKLPAELAIQMNVT
jgi:hypothetical protein